MSDTVHHLNQLLPKPELETLKEDSKSNLNEILKCLARLTNKSTDLNETVDLNIVNKLFTLLNFRRSLKFQCDDDLLENVLNTIYQTYVSKPCTISVKSVLLHILNDICSMRKHKIKTKFEVYDWRVCWDQAITIVTRAKKIESISSGEALIEYLSKLCSFTYNCRRFISESQANLIIQESMSLLSDTRQATCVEGLIMLVNCLPSYYSDYDSILPKWLELWRSINFSPVWDACWLALFVRARHHTKTFDWNSLIGWLLIKTKELLILPNNEPVHSNKMYRMEFQKYYLNMLPFGNQYRKLALCKIARLLYYCTTIYPSTAAADVTVMAYPISITPPSLSENSLFSVSKAVYPGFNNEAVEDGVEVYANANELGLFFQTLRHFLYASNSGNWTQNLSIFITYMISEMSEHVGISFIQNVYEFSDEVNATLEEKELLHFHKDHRQRLMRPMHIPTIKYLCGMLTVVSLEGLFGKDPQSSFAYGTNLKNLISIDPQIGHIVMPFLLSALTVVNQSHQAPIALHALTLCYRPLLYPVPIILSYLPELLQCVLPGLDTSDRTKSFITLHLIATVLSWTPVRAVYSQYEDPDILLTCSQSYLSMIERARLLTQGGAGDSSHSSSVSWIQDKTTVQAKFNTLSTTWLDWVPQFLDRFFALLEAREAKPPGKGSPQDSKGSGAMCEAVGYLFQAMTYSTDPLSIRQIVETKIIDYFKKSSPINAAKISGKMFEYMVVSSHGACLSRVVEAFLDQDTLTVGNISSDKLAFRLRLIGGAVRECNGCMLVPLMDKLRPYTESTFTHHAEKPVRKAAHKLVKDMLKGLTSIYPITVNPSMSTFSTDASRHGTESQSHGLVGEPVSVNTVEWHVPDQSTLHAAVTFLRDKTSTVMREVETVMKMIIDDTSNAAAASTSSISNKKQDDVSKVEDSIVYNFKILSKLLRGAAEILGDDSPASIDNNNTDQTSSLSSLQLMINTVLKSSSPVNNNNDDDDDDDGRFLHTARGNVISSMSGDDQMFVKQLRCKVLQFMIHVHQTLDQLASRQNKSTSTTSNNSVALVTNDIDMIASTSSTISNSKYVSFVNSEPIRNNWCKLLNVIVTRRTAWIRNADDAKKSLTMSKELAYSKLTEKIKHDLCHIFGTGGGYSYVSDTTVPQSGLSVTPSLQVNINSSVNAVISRHMSHQLSRGIFYWKVHDSNTNNAVNRVWVLYSKRQHEYAVAMNKFQSKSRSSSVSGDQSDDAYKLHIQSLICLVNLCSHEYDVIRYQAINAMSKLIKYYNLNYFMNGFLLNMMQLLSVPGTTYATASGILAIIKIPRIVSRICVDWNFTEMFLKVLLSTPAMVASSVIESEKKERLMIMLGEVMVQYSKYFNHIPIMRTTTKGEVEEEEDVAQRLLKTALTTLGTDNNTGSVVSVSAGMRYETYAGYIVLHLTGHNDIIFRRGVWVWVTRTVLNQRGQPTLFIAWSALVRLMYSAYVKNTTTLGGNNNSTSSSTSSGGNNLVTLLYDTFFKSVMDKTDISNSETNNWIDLLQGLSSCFNGSSTSSEGRAQWSRGILEILHSAEYLRASFPRKMFPTKAEPSYSSYVLRENVGLFLSLFSYMHRHRAIINTPFLTKEFVSVLLTQSKQLKSASEDENRYNNSIRASVWAGLYRSILSVDFMKSYDDAAILTQVLEIEGVLAQFFIEQVDKLSSDFCTDWAEAVMLTFVGNFPKNIIFQLKLVQYIMESFETVLADQSINADEQQVSSSSNQNSNESTAAGAVTTDGFSRIDNRLLLTEALLQSELSTDYHDRDQFTIINNNNTTTALIGTRILLYLKQPSISLISSYRSTREHMATIIVILSQLNGSERTPLNELWSKFDVTELSQETAAAETSAVSNTMTEVDTSMNIESINIDITNSYTSLSELSVITSATTTSTAAVVAAAPVSVDPAVTRKQMRVQHILQFTCHCLRYFAFESAANIEWVMPDIISLLSLALVGCGNSDIETAKMCHQTCIFVCITLKSFAPFVNTSTATATTTSVTSISSSSLSSLIQVLKGFSNHISFHVRETILLCANVVMTNNWFTLTSDDKKVLKDIISEGLVDGKPEVQTIAMGGMVAYLTAKSVKEITVIAEAYTKNSDILAAREKKKKKLSSMSGTEEGGTAAVTSSKPDKSYISNVMMVACIILTFPYDMPRFLPALVTSFVKHKNTAVVQNTVLKVIQNFKRTHQDRWEDFKKMFSHEQLEDIQGAGAAHYFS